MPRALPLVCVLSLALLTSAAFQKRVQKAEAKDFPAVLKEVGRAWEAGDYGVCLENLKKAMTLVTTKRMESIRAALPAAPEGWSIKPERDQAHDNPMVAAMAASVGSVVERTYTEDGGRGSVRCTITADSPMVQMFSMWAANPALLGPDAELIEYEGDHTAVLKTEGRDTVLQVLINKKHLAEVRTGALDGDGVLGFFSQAVVDALARVLG